MFFYLTKAYKVASKGVLQQYNSVASGVLSNRYTISAILLQLLTVMKKVFRVLTFKVYRQLIKDEM